MVKRVVFLRVEEMEATVKVLSLIAIYQTQNAKEINFVEVGNILAFYRR